MIWEKLKIFTFLLHQLSAGVFLLLRLMQLPVRFSQLLLHERNFLLLSGLLRQSSRSLLIQGRLSKLRLR